MSGTCISADTTAMMAECSVTASSQEPASAFLKLPDELQIKILGQLPTYDLLKATAVCRKWRNLALDGSLWTQIDATPFYSTIPAEQLLKIAVSAGKFLRVINLRGCVQVTGHALRTLSDHCPNIQVLQLKDCRGLSTASITCFLEKAHHLRSLDLSGLDSIKNMTLQMVGQLTLLEKLNLGWCRNITGHGMLAVAAGCRRLRYLKLNGCPQLEEPTLKALGEGLPELRQLCLASCTTLNDAALSAFLKTTRAPLSHLNLTNCAHLSDASLRHIAQHCTHLSHLDLAGCVSLTDQGFSYLSPRLRTLEHLDLEDLQQITGVTVRALAAHQTRLRRLCLSNCTRIADDAVIYLVKDGVCKQLRHLELDNCTITDNVLDTIATMLAQQQQQHEETFSSSSPTNSFDSNFSFFSASTSCLMNVQQRRRLSVEVLDCSNITEYGVRSALRKAGPLLQIKSFYSWRSDYADDDDDDDDEFHEASQRHHHQHQSPSPSALTRHRSPRRRYNTVGRQRRRREIVGGQPHAAANCIIL
ncbi:hypothetical protein VTP01DRAFT_9152 [Rhizomucor pusillus]|uniref:uncharacterized protein n=1 Tax=Rhizomucor pusillus TaxID=4840 RepID=UPI003743BC0E